MSIGKVMTINVIMLSVLVGFTTNTQAKERSRTGSYQGRKTSGTFQHETKRSRDQMHKNTTWQNERGEGSRNAERNWNRETKSEDYSVNGTTATGKTWSRNGTVTKNEEGSFTKQGTITGAQGKTTTVQSIMTKNEDGTRNVNSTYTGPEGKTLDVNSTIQKTENGRQTMGTYSSSIVKSGSFQGEVIHGDGQTEAHRSLTNQDGKTWQQDVERYREENAIHRDVAITDPAGETKTFQESVTRDEPQEEIEEKESE